MLARFAPHALPLAWQGLQVWHSKEGHIGTSKQVEIEQVVKVEICKKGILAKHVQ